jgi:outer membrane protein assembly factor BamB
MSAVLALLLACSLPSKGPRLRTVAPTLAAAAPAPLPAAPTIGAAPASWRTGRVDAAPIVRAPTIVWEARVDGPVVEPLSADSRCVYAVAVERVYCLDRAGRTRWSLRAGAVGGVAATAQGPAVGTRSGAVLLLDPERGATVASHVPPSCPEPCAHPPRGQPTALDGSLAWATVDGHVVTSLGSDAPVALTAGGSLAADGDIAFLATLEGELFAVRDGHVLWQAPLPAPAVEGPMLDEVRVYVAVGAADGSGGGVIAFTRDGAPVWRRRLDAQPSAPLAVGAFLYVATRDGRMYALDPATGAEAWTAQADAAFSVQPVVTRAGQAYAADGEGTLFRLDEDGGVAWTVPLGVAITGDPVLIDGLLVLGTADGRILALRAPSSSP